MEVAYPITNVRPSEEDEDLRRVADFFSKNPQFVLYKDFDDLLEARVGRWNRERSTGHLITQRQLEERSLKIPEESGFWQAFKKLFGAGKQDLEFEFDCSVDENLQTSFIFRVKNLDAGKGKQATMQFREEQ